jgi:16S rRNA (cytosine1402-N4)-methyltransferase
MNFIGMADSLLHRTVLLQEAVDALITDADGIYIDGTFGRGGHSRAILERLSEKGKLLMIDKDPEAIAVAQLEFANDPRVSIFHCSFADIVRFTDASFINGQVTGLLLDLGVSSPQLDDPDRGFSFGKDGPLDMRMDPSQGYSAAEWLMQAPEAEIATVLYEYGEERYSRRIARAIVRARQEMPLQSTLQLADLVKEAHPAWERHKHPATRTFQAIRIKVNNELEDLQKILTSTVNILRTAGRLVIISFHSLEDRMVKQFMQRHAKGDDFPPGLPVTQSQLNPTLKIIGKPVKASQEELAVNIRARSAVMRVAEKL